MLSDIITIKRYDRSFINSNPDHIFVFGDNMLREGFAGQAAEARNCRNAVGIPTKWSPNKFEKAYFKDSDYMFVAPVILGAFKTLRAYRLTGYNIYWPEDGIGTGYAQLPKKAPVICHLIDTQFELLKDLYK